MEQFRVEESNVDVLAIDQCFTNDCKARSYVDAISNNFAPYEKWLGKNKTFLFVRKCSDKVRNTCNLPAVVGTRGDNGMTRHQEARSILSHCPWRVRFKKQLDNRWVITELIDEHQGHQLEEINPYAYAKTDALNEEAKQAVLALIADMVNVTHGTHLLARDVYNRTYNHKEEKETSCAGT
ncbi:hypothetical protein V1506DRAFT_555608 [Lipomyces tetrasporus]